MITLAAAGGMGIVIDRAGGWPVCVAVAVVVVWLVRDRVSVAVFRWCVLLALVATTAAVRSRSDEASYRSASLLSLVSEDDQPVVLVGRVATLIQIVPKPPYALVAGVSPWQTRFDLDVTSVRSGGSFSPCDGRLAVVIDDEVDAIVAGDTLRLSGKLSAFSAPANPGETDQREVARNLRRHGRIFVPEASQAVVIERGGWGLRRLADRISRSGERTLRASLGDEFGILAAALTIGRRGALGPELEDQLLETGTIHLLSVSGLHMGIVALVLRMIGVVIGLRASSQLLFVGGACFLFVAVTGARPPVLRAAMLVGVVLSSGLFQRRPSPLNSLAFAAFVLMMLNPTDLSRVGVQLSFIAVATLVSCGHRYHRVGEELVAEAQIDQLVFSKRSRFYRRVMGLWGRLGNAVWFSLCVTLTTTPLVWLHFHLVTPVAVVANVILAIPMTVALVSGLGAVIFGMLGPMFAVPAGSVCYWALSLISGVIAVAAELPLGHFWLPAPPGWWVGFYYVALVAGCWLPRRWGRRSTFVGGTCGWCLVAWWLAFHPGGVDSPNLRATFLDVGHGTGVIVNLPDGRNFLYDCGSLGNQRHSARGIQEPLWALGLNRLDAILLSHADSDHYNALPGLLRRFSVDEIIIPVGMLDSPKPGLEPIREAIRRAGVSVREVSSEQQYFDGWSLSQIDILHPPRSRVLGNDNANSLVIRIDHQGTSLVLPGDLEPPGLEMVVRSPRPPAGGVLMSPHHGSLTVDSQYILDWARPREVVVSGGARARRPEVADALGVRGSGVHVTASLGAVRVEIAGSDFSDARSASGKPVSKGRHAKPRTELAEDTTRRGVDRPAQPSTRVTIRSWRNDPW